LGHKQGYEGRGGADEGEKAGADLDTAIGEGHRNRTDLKYRYETRDYEGAGDEVFSAKAKHNTATVIIRARLLSDESVLLTFHCIELFSKYCEF
jgi:hypothetical protein